LEQFLGKKSTECIIKKYKQENAHQPFGEINAGPLPVRPPQHPVQIDLIAA
jgi:hypothetical protein